MSQLITIKNAKCKFAADPFLCSIHNHPSSISFPSSVLLHVTFDPIEHLIAILYGGKGQIHQKRRQFLCKMQAKGFHL